MSSRHKAYIYLLIVALIWGIGGPVIKHTLNYFDPILFLTLRFFISSLVLIPIVLFIHPHIFHTLSKFTHSKWLFLIIASLLGSTLNLGILFWGFSLTSAIDGTLLNSTSPILVAIASYFVLHDRITPRERLGLFIAFLGSVIIVIQPLFATGSLFTGSLVGNLLVLLSNIAWTGYVILNKKELRQHLDPLVLTAIMFFIGFVSMFVTLLLTHSPSTILTTLQLAHHPSAYLGVLYMSLFSGILAYWLFQTGQRSIESSEANMFNYLPPLFATPISYFWLDEPITISFIVGSLIIASGVILAQTRAHRS